MCSKEELIKLGVVPEVLELFHMSSSDVANISSLLLNEKETSCVILQQLLFQIFLHPNLKIAKVIMQNISCFLQF